MSENEQSEDQRPDYGPVTEDIAIQIGLRLPQAPPVVLGAMFILAAREGGSGFLGLFGEGELFRFEVRNKSMKIVRKWMYENFSWFRNAIDKQEAKNTEKPAEEDPQQQDEQ